MAHSDPKSEPKESPDSRDAWAPHDAWGFPGDSEPSSLDDDSLFGFQPGKADPESPSASRDPSREREHEHEHEAFEAGPVTSPPPPADDQLINAFTLGSSGDMEDSLFRPASQAPEPSPNPSAWFPKMGTFIGGFLIVSELGRGTFGRVYLARQVDLGNRLVALKVTQPEGDEPQILAQLQHSHIVPIHSVHDDPATSLRLMCMPYLGGANLARVLRTVKGHQRARTNGKSLVDALDEVSRNLQSRQGVNLDDQNSLLFRPPQVSKHLRTRLATDLGPDAPPNLAVSFQLQSVPRPSIEANRGAQSLWRRLSIRGSGGSGSGDKPSEVQVNPHSRQFLRSASRIQASAWIIARLAEGLDHAHLKGLLHRDLKPSNVLITQDGTPMLLDFNLATLRRANPSLMENQDAIGGTLPYMAPEHLDAFHPEGMTLPEEVGVEADLYSLALILFEMIAGEPPFREPPDTLPMSDIINQMLEQRSRTPSLRALRPEVSWSLESIIRKALDPDPARRYHRAMELVEDLQRFLEDRPLKYAPELSVRERIAKWIRRHPRASSTTSIGLISLLILCAALGTITLLWDNLQGVSARLRFRNFESEFRECQLHLNTSSGQGSHILKGLQIAQRALRDEGNGLWDKTTEGKWTRWLPPADQALFREQMVELILMESRARTYLATQSGNENQQREALESAVRWLDRAEKIELRPTPALYDDRARYLAALGLADRARADRKLAEEIQPQTGRDFELLGTSLMVKREWAAAESALSRAVELDKRRFWAWFGLGYTRFSLGRYLEAAGSFSVCTALAPDFAWPYLNQGLALANAGRLLDALRAYDQALDHNPRFTEALVNRAFVHLELNDLARAEKDLDRAIQLGQQGSSVLAARGEILARLGRRFEAEKLYENLLRADPENAAIRVARAVLRLKFNPDAARADLQQVLKRNPRHARALYVMARLVPPKEPAEALKYVDASLQSDPSLADALQLRALLRARLGQLGAVDDVDLLLQAPTTGRLYNAACALAILGEANGDPRLADRALGLLLRAIDSGFSVATAADDPDLKSLKDRPEFQERIRKAKGVVPSPAQPSTLPAQPPPSTNLDMGPSTAIGVHAVHLASNPTPHVHAPLPPGISTLVRL